MPVDLNAVAETASKIKERGEKRGKTPFFKFKEGENKIRILPPFGNGTKFWIECLTAYGVGPKGNTIVPRAQFNLPCPYTEHLEKLHKNGDQASKEEASRIYPKKRFYIWLVERGAEDLGPQLLDANQYNFRDIAGIIADPDYGDITNPEKGTDIRVMYTKKEKSGTGFPVWQFLPQRMSSPLGTPDQVKTWTATDWNAEYDIGKPSDLGYIQAVLDGTTEEYFKSLSKDAASAETKPSSAPAPAAPPSMSTPPAPNVEPVILSPGDQDQKFWVQDPVSSAVVEMPAKAICNLIKQGHEKLNMMTYDQSSGWKTPFELGFKKEYPAPKAAIPPPPPGPVTTPPPPGPAAPPPPTTVTLPAPSADSSDEAALMAQLEAIRKKREANGSAGVSQEIQQALK